MEDLASMCERQCRKACNLRSAAEELDETGSNGRARRYRKRGSQKPAAEARAMEADPSPVRLWSAADSEGHSEGYLTAYPSESEEMARPPTRANTAPEPSLEHDAEALERPARARTAPVARHTEPTHDNMGNTPMTEGSEAPGTVGCARSGVKHVECHCEHVSFLIGKYPKMGSLSECLFFFLIDPQKFIDGSTSSPGCSVINENPGLFKFWADPVKPWITIKSPKATIWSRGKRNNLAVNFICLAQSRNRERRPLPSFATPFSWQCRKVGSRNVPQRTRPKANS